MSKCAGYVVSGMIAAYCECFRHTANREKYPVLKQLVRLLVIPWRFFVQMYRYSTLSSLLELPSTKSFSSSSANQPKGNTTLHYHTAATPFQPSLTPLIPLIFLQSLFQMSSLCDSSTTRALPGTHVHDFQQCSCWPDGGSYRRR